MKRFVLSMVVVMWASACAHKEPPPPAPMRPPPPRAQPAPAPAPQASIGVEQAKTLTLQFAANQNFPSAFVYWVRDHGSQWEIRIHTPNGPGGEKRMTVWVDHAGNMPTYVVAAPGTANWAD